MNQLNRFKIEILADFSFLRYNLLLDHAGSNKIGISVNINNIWSVIYILRIVLNGFKIANAFKLKHKYIFLTILKQFFVEVSTGVVSGYLINK